MAVTKKLYAMSIIAAVLVVALIFGVVKYWDDSRLSAVQEEVRKAQEETDSTRLLFLYNQILPSNDSTEFCRLVDFNLKAQMDKGYFLIRQMREYEKANLLSSYEETRKKYYLSNFEMWLYTVQRNEACAKDRKTIALFFTETRTFCPDCLVQGDILDNLRGACPNLSVITLATDLGLAPIDFLKSKHGITSGPVIVADGKTLKGLQNKDSLKKQLAC